MKLSVSPSANENRTPFALQVRSRCPACGGRKAQIFFTLSGVPANSCLLIPTRLQALGCRRGDLMLAACPACGLVYNAAFNPQLTEYSRQYEETQGFSPTFSAFQEELAGRLMQRHRLEGRTVLEIGCGKGEFLARLCELGVGRGIGFDPAFIAERNCRAAGRLKVIADFYSEHYAGIEADFICCKMTLEHVAEPAHLIRTIRSALGDRPDTAVFFQVPDASRILRDCTFEDVYYEHCNYFTPDSLSALFRRCGFRITSLETAYGGQYLLLEARPAAKGSLPRASANPPQLVWSRGFAAAWRRRTEVWRQRLADWRQQGKRAVLWGSGSKGVAFLTALGAAEAVVAAVDINPHRHGFHMAGSGLPIVSPEALRELAPEAVIVMNPIYRAEIGRDLQRLELEPEIWTV